MRSLSRIVIAAALMGAAALYGVHGPALAQAQASQAAALPPLQLTPIRVSANTWYVQGQSALGGPGNGNFVSNSGFIVTPAGVVVIDALGSPPLAREYIAQIKRMSGKDVTHVILTHYHADHVYGLQEFKRVGAKVIAHKLGQEYMNSETARQRLEVSRTDLAPWVDKDTHLVPADEWIDGPTEIVVGGVKLLIQPAGPAHTPEDVVVWVPSERVLFAGDIVFRGRVPYVGQADSKHWIAALNNILAFEPVAMVPGHGPMSTTPRADIELTRDYLQYLRESMRKAAFDMDPFEEAYARTDWSRFENLPLFKAANRMNAYNTYLLMESEASKR